MEKEKINKILDIIKWGEQYFKEKKIPEPRLNIELMLCKILQCKRMNLYLNFDKPLNKNELDILREFIKRRIKREPLQYILGETEFMGFNFKVNHNVLIPRPETELLVEEVIKLSKVNPKNELKILDIGSGSGNIAISLAKLLPNSKILSIDYSKNAIELAKYNAINNNVEDRVVFLELDILKEKIPDYKFDFIVSNPPYISIQEYNSLDSELKYEPQQALTDFGDGYTFYHKIIEISKKHLEKDGYLVLEMAYNQSINIKNIFIENNFQNIEIVKDYSNIDRIIKGNY